MLWLPELDLSDELWASLAIPIGLAFLYRDGRGGEVVALYPSAAGTTAQRARPRRPGSGIVAANPVLEDLEDDVEALVVDRLGEQPPLRRGADRRVLPAGGHDPPGLGGHLGRRRASREAVDAFFGELQAGVPT